MTLARSEIIAIELHDIAKNKKRKIHSSKKCKDDTERSLVQTVIQLRDTITMGQIIGKPIFKKVNSKRHVFK